MDQYEAAYGDLKPIRGKEVETCGEPCKQCELIDLYRNEKPTDRRDINEARAAQGLAPLNEAIHESIVAGINRYRKEKP